MKKKAAVKDVPVKTDIASVEDETIRRVNRTLTTIEDFLAKWDASRARPDSMFPHITKIRQFHDALVSWQSGALRSRGKAGDEERIKRLRDFVLLCRTYS